MIPIPLKLLADRQQRPELEQLPGEPHTPIEEYGRQSQKHNICNDRAAILKEHAAYGGQQSKGQRRRMPGGGIMAGLEARRAGLWQKQIICGGLEGSAGLIKGVVAEIGASSS